MTYIKKGSVIMLLKIIKKFSIFEWSMILAVIGFTIYFANINSCFIFKNCHFNLHSNEFIFYQKFYLITSTKFVRMLEVKISHLKIR